MYSYFPAQSSLIVGSAGSSGMRTQRMAASTSLCPFSGSFASHLSITQAIAPVSLTGSPAFTAPLARMHKAAGSTTKSCFSFFASLGELKLGMIGFIW
jgi:hypothetical protein